MTRAQWGVLARLQRQEGMTQAEMARPEIQPISLVRLIDRLSSTASSSGARIRDRRANRLYLTDKGHTTLVRLARSAERSRARCWLRSATRTSPHCCRSCS